MPKCKRCGTAMQWGRVLPRATFLSRDHLNGMVWCVAGASVCVWKWNFVGPSMFDRIFLCCPFTNMGFSVDACGSGTTGEVSFVDLTSPRQLAFHDKLVPFALANLAFKEDDLPRCRFLLGFMLYHHFALLERWLPSDETRVSVCSLS